MKYEPYIFMAVFFFFMKSSYGLTFKKSEASSKEPFDLGMTYGQVFITSFFNVFIGNSDTKG